MLLVHFLRDELGLTGRPTLGLRHLELRHLRRADGRRAGQVVHGAGGHCGRPEIETVEGLDTGGALDPIQQRCGTR
jgi:aerobic-type carbon monoxide dehydrogenase small subunit (CoxS/CutS family)